MLSAHWLFTQARFELNGVAVVVGAIIFSAVYGLYLIAFPANVLQVDRWSAVISFWDTLFSSRYPYAATTHLGNPIGPSLPFQFYAALPFYALPDMGILTLTGVIGFVGVVLLSKDHKQALAIILACACAPGIWWELAARSTLISNIALALLFLLVVDRAALRP